MSETRIHHKIYFSSCSTEMQLVPNVPLSRHERVFVCTMVE